MKAAPSSPCRHLVLVLGDQLNADSAAFDAFDPAQDAVWTAEVTEESTHVKSHKARIALFLSAMRHFRDALRGRGWLVHCHQLDDPKNAGTLAGELAAAAKQSRPQELILVEPGAWRVQESLRTTARELGVDLEIHPDRHFLCTREDFATLYWDFLIRHEAMLKKNPRTAVQARNATHLSAVVRLEIKDSAARLREAISAAT
jgi:deoxyribodipyrimidine photolyase-related protein